VHPLLCVEFGPDNHCLYVLKELDDEVSRSRRLKTKFPWTFEGDYRRNRSARINVSRTQLSAIAQAEEFLWDHVVNDLPGPSPTDCKALAYGFVLGIPVVTDDHDMIELATVFDIRVMTTLQLLNLMQTCGHVTLAMVRGIVRFWTHEKDLPAGCREHYETVFGEPFPT
jgi:hypothetical protein